jgi:hypothetical protein
LLPAAPWRQERTLRGLSERLQIGVPSTRWPTHPRRSAACAGLLRAGHGPRPAWRSRRARAPR